MSQTVTLRNPFIYPLHRQNWFRPPGNLDYRVTNPFNGPDKLNGGIHRATDFGNMSRGFRLNAPAAGEARAVRHFDGALGVLLEVGDVELGFWHLDSWTLPVPDRAYGTRDRIGPAVQLAVGQQIGVTGASGAKLPDGSPMPAHTHIEARRAGALFDIEPYLFGQPLVIGPSIPDTSTQEDPMLRFPANHLHTLGNAPAYKLTTDARFRAEPSTTSETFEVFKAGMVVRSAWFVNGQAVGSNDEWLLAVLYTSKHGAYVSGYFHSSVLAAVPEVATDADRRIGAAAPSLTAASKAITQAGTALATAQKALTG